MHPNRNPTQFKALLQSKKLEEVEKALFLAKKNNFEIDEKVIDDLYVYLRGPRPKDIPTTLANKIKVINCCSKIHCYLKGTPLELKQFLYLEHIKKVTITFQCYAFQYIQIFLKRIFQHNKIEVLKLVNYPLTFLPKEIEAMENLRVLACISSKIEAMPSLKQNLNKLEELDLTNSKNIAITAFLEKTPHLRKVTISKTKLISKLSALKTQYPQCEIIH